MALSKAKLVHDDAAVDGVARAVLLQLNARLNAWRSLCTKLDGDDGITTTTYGAELDGDAELLSNAGTNTEITV
jgi:hypothetical protein